MKFRYKYIGKTPRDLPGPRRVKNGDIVDLDIKIDNPLFEPIEDVPSERSSRKNKSEDKDA